MYENLLDNSIKAMLAAIEIYNKPDFKYRGQVFSILLVNSWELLLKAKILFDNNNQIESLYVILPDGSYKRNRTENFLTIEIFSAIKKLNLSATISENLNCLIDIRDTAIHFFHDDTLDYAVYTLGIASLKNYQRLVKEWFDESLQKYNFYILPVGFAYNFETLSLIDFQNKPDIVKNFINSIKESKSKLDSSDFHFICEITTKVVSAKKFTVDTPPDLITAIDQNTNPEQLIIHKFQHLIDKYPLSYSELVEKIKRQIPETNNFIINKLIKETKIKTNKDYSAYNFRTKKQFDYYERTGELDSYVHSIYNEAAVRFIVGKISELEQ
jgi:hypothetical protein